MHAKNPSILFVYGTLAPNEENAHIMDGMVGVWEKASVRGHRFQTGWGVHRNHPGLHLDPTGPEVHGLIFISNDLPAHWNRLDIFEGADYQRIEVEATLETGDKITAQVYSAVKR